MGLVGLDDDAQIRVRLQALIVALGDFVPDAGVAGAEDESAPAPLGLDGSTTLPRLFLTAIEPAGR